MFSTKTGNVVEFVMLTSVDVNICFKCVGTVHFSLLIVFGYSDELFFLVKQQQLPLSPHVVVSFPLCALCQQLMETDELMENQTHTSFSSKN